MPGPVSDSYDPEWGTTANGALIDEALEAVYRQLTTILNDQPPVNILELVQRDDMSNGIEARLTEKEWRLLRFAVERARESL